jgi:hypothetical protein
MRQLQWMVMGCALAMTLGFVLALAVPAGAQPQSPGSSSDTEPPPPTKYRASAAFIDWQLGSAVLRLERALAMQTNGTIPDPKETSTLIYEGYVRVRSAHALLLRRKDKQEAKSGIPDPELGLAFKIVRKARFSVLYAREAAAKSQTDKSILHLNTALADLSHARALIH